MRVLQVNWLRHFTTCNNRENLSIEQAEAFLANNAQAQCALEEQDRRHQEQAALALAARRRQVVTRAASADCLQRPPKAPASNPRLAVADMADDQGRARRLRASAPECRRDHQTEEDFEATKRDEAGDSLPISASPQPPCRNALLTLAAAGHHREKFKRMRSTSN
jgi:hypothetical protein